MTGRRVEREWIGGEVVRRSRQEKESREANANRLEGVTEQAMKRKKLYTRILPRKNKQTKKTGCGWKGD